MHNDLMLRMQCQVLNLAALRNVIQDPRPEPSYGFISIEVEGSLNFAIKFSSVIMITVHLYTASGTEQ